MVFRLFPFVISAALAGCTLGTQPAPPLTGPSELALSLAVSASPDHLSQDGASVSVITVTARDAFGQAVPGLSLHAELQVSGIQADLGTLSSRTLLTTSDGRASVAYLAPPPPPATVSEDNLVTILITPIGTDFRSASSRSVKIRLVRPA